MWWLVYRDAKTARFSNSVAGCVSLPAPPPAHHIPFIFQQIPATIELQSIVINLQLMKKYHMPGQPLLRYFNQDEFVAFSAKIKDRRTES